MPDELVLFPVAKAILTIPFWLKSAPGPMSVEDRQKLLEDVAAKLTGPSAQWEVLKLEWRREPYSVDQSKIWHPKPAVNRKRSILKGSLPHAEAYKELCSLGKEMKLDVSPQRIKFKIQECSIFYFDYGICALEYVFSFSPVTATRPRPIWPESRFWGNFAICPESRFWGDFKKLIMAAVESRKFGVLKDPCWPNLQKSLVGAFKKTVNEAKTADQVKTVPYHEIFGSSKDDPGHVCASFGLNFILFGNFSDQTLDSPSDLLNRTVERFIGRPIAQPDGGARSEDLAYVFYGAVHPLVIIRRSPETKEAAGAVAAARVMLRYLWMGYGVLAEVPRGLMALQRKYYLGYEDSPAAEIRREVINLDRAGQTLDLLIAEFHFSMFWESEIEYDIYHSAYEQWKMKELAQFVKDTLSGATKTAEVLRRRIDIARQRKVATIISLLTTFTIVSVVVNIFSLTKLELENFETPYISITKWELENLEIPSHIFGYTWDIIHNIGSHFAYYPITIIIVLFCLCFFSLIYIWNREQVANEPCDELSAPRLRDRIKARMGLSDSAINGGRILKRGG